MRSVPVARELIEYAVKITGSSRPGQSGSLDFIDKYISWGAGTRASQYLILAAKSRALLSGRAHVSIDDIKAIGLHEFIDDLQTRLNDVSNVVFETFFSISAATSAVQDQSQH